MESEWNLSDKIKSEHLKAEMIETNKWGTIPMIKFDDGSACAETHYPKLEIEDVREFIKRLKEEIKNCYECGCNLTPQDIDKLAGDKLC